MFVPQEEAVKEICFSSCRDVTGKKMFDMDQIFFFLILFLMFSPYQSKGWFNKLKVTSRVAQSVVYPQGTCPTLHLKFWI